MDRKNRVDNSFSKINIGEFANSKNGKIVINKTKLKKSIATILSTVLITLIIQDEVLANEINNTVQTVSYKNPTQLNAFFEFVGWLIDLLRLIVSGVAGLICTFAGYKWATSLESNGQESAKKILKNAFIGGIIVWTGSSIAGFFVDKMNQILL